MKNSGLFIGLGIGLLAGAAIGLYIATDDEKKAAILDEIKDKAEEAKKSVGKIVKQGLEELDNAIDTFKQTVHDTISKKDVEAEPV
jgi:gas vesicle protein